MHENVSGLNQHKGDKHKRYFFISGGLCLIVVIGLLNVVRPDYDLSSKRTYLISNQAALAQRMTAEMIGKQESTTITNDLTRASYSKWREGHRTMNDFFGFKVQDQAVTDLLSAMNAQYHKVNALLESAELNEGQLIKEAEVYATLGDRLFLAETTRISKRSQIHEWISWGAIVLIAMVFFILFKKFIAGTIRIKNEQIDSQQQDLKVIEQEHQDILNFIGRTMASFEHDLHLMLKSGLDASGARDRAEKLERSARSAGLLMSQIKQSDQNLVPFSIEGLIKDVNDHISAEHRYSGIQLDTKVTGSLKSATGQPDLIGALVSQICILIIEKSKSRAMALTAKAEALSTESVSIEFSFQVDQVPAHVFTDALSSLLTEGDNDDFDATLIRGLVRYIGGKLWFDLENGRASLRLRLICKNYADEVSFDDTSNLSGKRIFIVDNSLENLRIVVRQLSGYGVQAIPYNSVNPILENPESLRKFDAGIMVYRQESFSPQETMVAVRANFEPTQLPVLGICPETNNAPSGVAWDALLTGNHTEAEMVSALLFCLHDKSSIEGDDHPGVSRQVHFSALQRANR